MQKTLSTLRGSFSPLRYRNFSIYLGGQAVSLVGTWLQITAQGWLVWKLTGSEASLGVVNMFGTLPLLILTPWTGIWADRLDRRKLLIVTQIGAMLLAFILAFLVQTDLVQLWHVYLLSLLLGVITALDMPTQQAFLGDLSGMGEVRKAINLNIMMLQVSRILGPAVAGFLIGAIGAAPAFWLNGLSFLAVVVSLMIVRANNQVRATHSGSALDGFAESVRFVAGQPRLVDLLVFAILITFFGLSIILSQLPAFNGTVLDNAPDTLGWLMAASGVGALIGVSILAPLAQSARRTGMVLGIAIIWMGTCYVLFAASTSLPVAALSLFFASFTPPVVMTTAGGLVQVMSPPAMRARLMSLFLMISFGTQPLAALAVGFAAEHLSVPVAIQVNGIAMIVFAGLMLLRPALRRWDMVAPQVVAPVGEALEAVGD
jgi:MFS family permease